MWGASRSACSLSESELNERSIATYACTDLNDGRVLLEVSEIIQSKNGQSINS